MKSYKLCLLVLLSLYSQYLYADQCSAVYPSVVQSHANGGSLIMNTGTTIVDSPTVDFSFSSASINVTPSNTTCVDSASGQTRTCSVSGASAGSFSLPTFPAMSNGYVEFNNANAVLGQGSTNTNRFGQVAVNGGTMRFSNNYSEYFIRSLSLNSGAVVSMKPGTYWIENLYLNAGSAGLLQVEGSGTVRVFVKNNIDVNNPIKGILNDALLNLNTYGNFTINSGGVASGIFYINGNTTLNNAPLTGMLSTSGLTMNSGSAIYFDDDKFEQLDFGTLCEAVTIEPELQAKYQFEESQWPNNNSVLDSSTNSNHASPIGLVSPLLPLQQKSCQALNVPFNSSTNNNSAVDSQIDINDVGDQGTISFWYRSHQAWDSGMATQLLDASSDNNGNAQDKYFFLAKSGSGQLQFGLEDANDTDLDVRTGNYSFAADQWVHIAITWDVGHSELAIFVNGVAASLTSNGGVLNTQIGDLDTLYIGDNRSSYFVGGLSSTNNSADGQFDDVRIYSGLQSQAQISTDMNDISPCSVEPLAFYQFEQNEWNSAGAVTDSGSNNFDGTAIGSVSPLFPSEQKSCKVLDVPFSDSTNNNNAVDTNIAVNDIGNQGTISFWYRSNQAWNSGVPRQLLDASTDTNGNALDKYFYLTITDNGSLRFGLEDSNDADLDVRSGAYSFAANQWVHIAATWNTANSELNIIVNGVAATLSSNGGVLNGQIAQLSTLHIGDNRSSYFGGPSTTANSADGQFDDVRIYQRQQTLDSVNTDMNTLTPCELQMAYYQFEQQQWNSNGDVLDSSDSLNHGTAYGAASPLFPSVQKSCKVLDIPSNTSSPARSAVDSGIDVNSIGNKGSISFWYRSDVAWNGGGDRQLFDATNASTGSVGQDQVFFLTLTESGGLHFSLEDSDDLNLWVVTNNSFSFAANEWVHIAVTWDMANNVLRIFVNGNQQATSGVTQPELGSVIGDYDTLFFGDSRSSYVIANQPHTHNSANGQFDDVRIYNFNQSSADIAVDMADLNPCQADVIFYQFEEAQWSGNESILDSSGNDHHGTPFGNVAPVLPSNQKSCQAMLVPDNQTYSAQEGLHTNFDINDLGNAGTISFWFQSIDAWQSAGHNRVLFDASENGNRFVFYLLSNGQLSAEISESDGDTRIVNSQTNYNFGSNTWVHLALTWDALSDQLTMYVNGNAGSQTTNNVYLDEGMAALTTLGIGDNRSTTSSTSPVSASSDGYFDDVRVYAYAQPRSEISTDMQDISPCAFVDHYQLEFSGTGYTCSNSLITVSACMDSDCSSTYPSPSSLQMETSSGSYTEADLLFTGSTQTSLIKNDAGLAIIGINNSSPSAPVRCVVNGAEDACIITIEEGGLTISWAAATTPPQNIPDQLSQEALNQPIYISNNTNGACAADLAGKELLLAVNCDDPASCNSNMLNLSGSTINQPDSFTATNLFFDENGEVIIPENTIRYDDAGQIQLRVKDSEELTAGVSNLFIAVPELQLTYQANNSDPAVDPLITAGIDFGLSVTAVGQMEVVTPNYHPGQLQLEAVKLSPNDDDGNIIGTDGNLVTSNTFVTGTGQASFTTDSGYTNFDSDQVNISAGRTQGWQAYYSEVGEIVINLQDADYFGYNLPTSVALNRFIPAYFTITDNSPLMADSCPSGGFSYVGQSLEFATEPTFTYHPFNAKNQVINNYLGDLMRLAAPAELDDVIEFADSSAFSDAGGESMTQELGTLSLPDSDISQVVLSDSILKYILDANPIAPFESEIQVNLLLSDQDGVCYNPNNDGTQTFDSSWDCEAYTIIDIGGANLRYGRLVMENAYGPETESLTVPMMTQYYDGTRWVLNTDDSCTAFDSANSKLDEDNSSYSADEIPERSGAGIFSAGQSTTLSDSINVAPPMDVDGDGEIDVIEFPLLLTEPDYLFFDWNGDGIITPISDDDPFSEDAPSAIITFGQYRGNDRIINWREVFN